MDSTQLTIELSRLKGAKFLGLTTATKPSKMRKTNGQRKKAEKRANPFYGRVLCVRNVVYQPCYDYGGAVNRAQAKAGVGDGASFETGETWYERVKDADGHLTAFGRHKETGAIYFIGREMSQSDTTYIATEDIPMLSDDEDNEPTGDILYRAGEVVPFEAIKPFMPEYKPSAKQGLDKDDEIRARSLKLESIWAIRRDGTREVIDPNPNRNDVAEVVAAINGMMRDMPDIDLDSIPADAAVVA